MDFHFVSLLFVIFGVLKIRHKNSQYENVHIDVQCSLNGKGLIALHECLANIGNAERMCSNVKSANEMEAGKGGSTKAEL